MKKLSKTRSHEAPRLLRVTRAGAGMVVVSPERHDVVCGAVWAASRQGRGAVLSAVLLAENVRQWVSDWYRPDYYAQRRAVGTVADNPHGPDSPFDPAEPGERKRVHRGGSFLCTDEYYSRYMVGTRGKGEIATGTNHLGFRCVEDRR